MYMRGTELNNLTLFIISIRSINHSQQHWCKSNLIFLNVMCIQWVYPCSNWLYIPRSIVISSFLWHNSYQVKKVFRLVPQQVLEVTDKPVDVALARSLVDNVLVIVIAQSSWQLLIVHLGLVLANSPAACNLKVIQKEIQLCKAFCYHGELPDSNHLALPQEAFYLIPVVSCACVVLTSARAPKGRPHHPPLPPAIPSIFSYPAILAATCICVC